MSSAYFAPLVMRPVLLNEPGTYRTRGGDLVTITAVSTRHNFGCFGTYSNGIRDGWHMSGRLYATSECQNDIVGKESK